VASGSSSPPLVVEAPVVPGPAVVSGAGDPLVVDVSGGDVFDVVSGASVVSISLELSLESELSELPLSELSVVPGNGTSEGPISAVVSISLESELSELSLSAPLSVIAVVSISLESELSELSELSVVSGSSSPPLVVPVPLVVSAEVVSVFELVVSGD